MTRAVWRAVNEVARTQAGHVTRAQLIEAGLHRSTIRRQALAGLLVPVGGRTYRLASVARSRQGDVLAACLDADGVASHWTAAWLHGLAVHRSLIDVTVEKGSRMHQLVRVGSQQPRVRIHSTTNLAADDIVMVERIRTTGVARTMLGLAAVVPQELSQRGLFEVVGAAVDGRLATDPWLWWLLSQRRCRGRNGVTALESALADRARLGPTESWLEREALRILEVAGIPLPATQRVVRRSGRFAARVDFLYDPDLIIEALGYAFHRTEAQMADDVARANTLQLAGCQVYQFTARQIVSAPERFVATVRDVLARRNRPAA